MYSTNEVLEKFGITYQTLNVYRKKLNLELSKNSKGHLYFSQESLDEISAYKEFLKSGGLSSNYKKSDVDSGDIIQVKETAITEKPLDEWLVENIEKNSQKIDYLAEKLATKDIFTEIEKLEYLKKLADLNIQVPTSVIKGLIGVAPIKNMVRGSFSFVAKGKIGNQTAWVVAYHTTTI